MSCENLSKEQLGKLTKRHLLFHWADHAGGAKAAEINNDQVGLINNSQRAASLMEVFETRFGMRLELQTRPLRFQDE